MKTHRIRKKMTLKEILILFLLPTLTNAECKPMTDVPAEYRTHKNTDCDSATDCVCREFTSSDSEGWLQCDLRGDLSIFPRICTVEEIGREVDCMPIEEFESMDITDNCGGDCPDKCRIFPPLFATCDIGDDFAGSREFPLKCAEIVPTRRPKTPDLSCESLEAYPDAIFHINSKCWNTKDFCNHGKCRVLGTSTGGYYFDCDEGNNFEGVFAPLCDPIL